MGCYVLTRAEINPRVNYSFFNFFINTTPPPPYFHWNYNIDIVNNIYFHWNNIVYAKKKKRRILDILFLYIKLSYLEGSLC